MVYNWEYVFLKMLLSVKSWILTTYEVQINILLQSLLDSVRFQTPKLFLYFFFYFVVFKFICPACFVWLRFWEEIILNFAAF